MTPDKVRETKYFVQKDKAEDIKRLDGQVASIQHEMAARKDNGESYDAISLKLRRIRQKRERVAKEYDRLLVAQIRDYIQELSEKHTVYVALGRLKHIRSSAQRGGRNGRYFRGMVHRWAFARIGEALKHQLAQLGWPVEGRDARFRVVPENWTSTMCWKCGHRGRRPRQNYFVCPTCGHKTNADRNGAINIAGRLIMLTSSLHEVRGLGKWADSVEAGERLLLKAAGKTLSSRRMSLLFKRSDVSHSEESAAVHHVQTDNLSFGDESEIGDNDPAVARTVENLSVVGHDTPTSRQEKEVRTVRGMQSQ
jgi:hypothetical protein